MLESAFKTCKFVKSNPIRPVPFCHFGDGHHLTGFPPAYLFLPALVGEPKLLAADDEPPTCLRGALAPAAMTTNDIDQSLGCDYYKMNSLWLVSVSDKRGVSGQK